MIPCELYLTSTPFRDTKQFTYEIDLPPAGDKSGLNLLDDEYSTIHYVIDKILNSSSGHQIPTQAKKMCGSLLSMENIQSQLKARFMNSRAIIINVENTSSIAVYLEGRTTRGHIMKLFGPYLIKSDLCFHILKLVSQRNLRPQTTLVKL